MTVSVPILMCLNNRFVLMYTVLRILVNDVNNEFHNLLQYTELLAAALSQKYAPLHSYLSPTLHFSIQK